MGTSGITSIEKATCHTWLSHKRDMDAYFGGTASIYDFMADPLTLSLIIAGNLPSNIGVYL